MTAQEKAVHAAEELVRHWCIKRGRGIADTYQIGEATIKVEMETFLQSDAVLWHFYVNSIQIEKDALIQALTMLPALHVMIAAIS